MKLHIIHGMVKNVITTINNLLFTTPKEGPHQIGNPYRLGFFELCKKKLLELGYTLILYEQKKRYVENKKELNINKYIKKSKRF